MENVFLSLLVPWIPLWICWWGWFQVFWWFVCCRHCLKNWREHQLIQVMQAFGRWQCPARSEMVPSHCSYLHLYRILDLQISFLLIWSFIHSIYILRKSDNWTKSKLKNLWDDSSCNIFSPLSFEPDCCKILTFVLFSEWCFLLMTCSCSEFILFFSTVRYSSSAT